MIEWIVSSAVLIAVIIILRQLLKGKISLRLQYALWAIVLVRLLVPISFGQTKFSVQNAVQAGQAIQAELGESAEPPSITIDIPPSRADYVPPDLSVVEPDPSLPKAEQEQQYEQNKQQWKDIMDADWEEYKAENTAHVTLSVPDILRVLWLAGIAAVALVFLISNLRFGRRLRRSRQVLAADCPLPVYLSEAVETPCLFGLFRPAIYVTSEVAGDEAALSHVLAHETTHFRHWDHIWAVLRCVCLAVHWYNPLVWLAAALSRRDAELACDEGAIRRIGEGERAAYGRTLIGLTCAHRGNLLHTATTMTGGKKSIKERIVLIAKKPKMAVCTLIAVILIAAVAVGCTFTGAARTPEQGFVAWVEELKESDFGLTLRAATNKGDLDRNQYARLYAILGTIEEDDFSELPAGETPDQGVPAQIVAVDTDPFLYIKGIAEEPTRGEWDFYCTGDGTIAVSASYDVAKEYGFDEWRLLDCPTLYDFIVELNREEDHEPPAFVQVAAEFQMEQRRAEVEQKYIAVSVTHEVLAELKGLTRLELGTAGLDYAVEMWRMDYDITVAINRGQEANTAAHILYLVVLYDYTTEKYTRFLSSMDEKTLNRTYNTPELIGKYGDMYVAAAMELYHACREGQENILAENPVYHVPQAVVDYAYQVGANEISFMKYENGETKTELTEIENMNSGVAEDDFSVDVYRAHFLTTNISAPSAFTAMGKGFYLIVLWQQLPGGGDTVLIPLGYIGSGYTYFNTEEMLQKYGSPYTAMAEGFYNAYLARLGETGEYPATPGQALEQICAKGDTLSLGHYWSFFGDAEETKADPAETLSFWRPYLDEPLWIKLDFVPDETADCTFTLTSEDGTGTLRALLDLDLIEYTSGGETVYWMAADNRYHEAAGLARNIYFNNLYAAEIARTPGAVRYGFYEFNFTGGESQLIIETGETEEDRVYHFYGLVEGVLTEIATVDGAYSYLANGVHEYGEQDLVLAGAHEGEEWAYRLIWGGFREAQAEVKLLYRRAVDGDNYTEWPDRIEMYEVTAEWNDTRSPI